MHRQDSSTVAPISKTFFPLLFLSCSYVLHRSPSGPWTPGLSQHYLLLSMLHPMISPYILSIAILYIDTIYITHKYAATTSLRQKLPGLLISWGCDVQLPPCSPDSNVLDGSFRGICVPRAQTHLLVRLQHFQKSEVMFKRWQLTFVTKKTLCCTWAKML